MEHLRIKNLMVPISEYATVLVGTSLLNAIIALEKAQEAYTTSKYQHRAILVLDNDTNVVGKISQLRILKAVETRYDLDTEIENLSSFRFSEDYISKRQEQYRLKGPILDRVALSKAAEKKVEEFMQRPTPGEYVSVDCSVDVAIHKLVAGTHLSLLVTQEDKIVGMLRISDVFAAVFHEMRDAAATSDRRNISPDS